MGFFRWFTKNSANTHEPTHADLAPFSIPASPDVAVDAINAAVKSLKNWRVESEAAGEFKLTRRTGVVGFVDDITVTLVPAGPDTLLHAASKSRVGIGDFGQNRRNILELWNAIRATL